MPLFTWSANQCSVYVAGIQIILLQDVRAEDRYPLERVSGIGSIRGMDLVPTEALYSITVSGFITRTQQAISAGVWPENADVALIGKVFAVEVFSTDPASPRLLRKYTDAKVESGSFNLVSHRQMTLAMTLQALDCSGTLT